MNLNSLCSTQILEYETSAVVVMGVSLRVKNVFKVPSFLQETLPSLNFMNKTRVGIFQKHKDVASDVGVNFKNVGVLTIESSLFHLFHYTFLQTKHQRKGY